MKRIKAYAGEQYWFEEFIANDKVGEAIVSRSLDIPSFVESRMHLLHSTPQIHRGSPLK